MDCPKCPGKLESKDMEKITVDVCFVCEGVWLDGGELEQVVKADSKDFKYIDLDKSEYDGNELQSSGINLNDKQGKCPRCTDGTMLQPIQYNKNIKIDICPHAHGVWLDGGELQKLRHRGLVKISDKIDIYIEFFKFIFSKQGFKDFGAILKGRKPIEFHDEEVKKEESKD